MTGQPLVIDMGISLCFPKQRTVLETYEKNGSFGKLRSFFGGVGLFFGRDYGSFREYNQVGEEKKSAVEMVKHSVDMILSHII